MLRTLILFILTTVLMVGGCAAKAWALPGTAGPYRVELTTDPSVIPVGKAEAVLTITADGQPVTGATVTTFTQMPGMKMGEKRETAREVGAGVYRSNAPFPMGGGYTVTVTVTGTQGTGEAVFHVSTGQDTTPGTGAPWLPVILGLAVLALAAFTVHRMRATGQRLDLRPNRQVIGGLLLMAAMLAVGFWAVKNLRRPGAMTPIEAQVMEMNMPAPVGVTPVELAKVERGDLEDVVRYTGQAVAYEEQPVTSRTEGVVEWMPFYVGDSVRRGQELARLDVSQLEPRLAASRAEARMAVERRSVAEAEHHQHFGELDRAEAEREAAVAAAEGARARVRDAEAEVAAARADVDYRRNLYERSRELAREGAVSEEELQRDRAEAADAEARLRTALAKVTETRADLREAEAMIAARTAEVRSVRSALETGARRISEAEAGLEAARSQEQAVTAERGYADVVSNLDGVVTERLVSPGTLVQAGTPLLRVAQIDPIRLQANVAEADLARMEVGRRVRVRDARGRSVEGRITALRPALDPGARQGLVEAVVPNPDHRFLPGAYVSMEIVASRSDAALLVPSQAVGSGPTGPFVWRVEGSPGSYTVRREVVKTGSSDGQRTAILSGLSPGDLVVAAGGQFLREGDPVAPEGEEAAPAAHHHGDVQTATIRVSSEGFDPPSLALRPGVPARLTFLRVDEENCGTEVFFPELGLERKLPLNQPVVVEITPKEGQDLSFTCGMNMLKGKVVAK